MPTLVLNTLQKATVTAGTAVALSATPLLVRGLKIKALPANTDEVYVGGPAVDAASGYVLEAKEEINYADVLGLDPDVAVDLSLIYVDSAVDAEGVCVSYLEL